MKISLYYNQTMFLLKDSSDPAERVTLITDDNIEEVYDTVCLYQNDINAVSTLTQMEIPTSTMKANMADRYGKTAIESVFLEEKYDDYNNTTYGFAHTRISLKKFFEKYRVREIHPLQYVLKKLNSNGLVGIVSPELFYMRENRPNVMISSSGSDNFYGGSSTDSSYEHTLFNKSQDLYENSIKQTIASSTISSVSIFTTYPSLDLGITYADLSLKEIKDLLDSSGFKIVDRISDIYKRRVTKRNLIFINIFIVALTIAATIYFITNKTVVAFLESDIDELREKIEKTDGYISKANEYLPNMNLEEFNVDKVANTLEKYTKYYPEKVVYTFKDSKSIQINFTIKDAWLAEELISNLRKNKLKFKYNKASGYTFIFDIEESVTNPSTKRLLKKGE